MESINQAPSERQRLRAALIEFGQWRPWTHWVTLNTYRDFSMDAARACLKRWRVEMLRRLHGHRFYLLPEDERFAYFGAHHFSAAGEPHYHLACWVPPALLNRFLRVAPARWKDIVPSGVCHVEAIDSDPDSPRVVLSYALKVFDPRDPMPFVDSRMYR